MYKIKYIYMVMDSSVVDLSPGFSSYSDMKLTG